MKKAVIYVHGKGGSAEEVGHYKALFPDYEIIGFDYKSQTPWEAKKEFPDYFAEKKKSFESIILIANSIGALFSIYSLDRTLVDRAYFISPIVNMEDLILRMMQQAKVTETELEEKGEIKADFSETLSWRYLCYVREHPISFNVPTYILYGERDNLTSFKIISDFAEKHHAYLTVMPGGEHWFHTEEQMSFLDSWIRNAEEHIPVVRRATRDELERINKLRRAVSELHAKGRPDIFRPGFGGSLAQHVYDIFDLPDYDVFAAFVNKTLCGFAIVNYTDKPESAYMCAQRFIHVDEFGVDEKFRRCRVGTALIDFLKSEAKQNGFERLTLDVWEFNEPAKKFYESIGFNPFRSYLELNF